VTGEQAGLGGGVHVRLAIPGGAHLLVQLGAVALKIGGLRLKGLEALNGGGVEFRPLGNLQ
jgi:hypothetical protein